MKTSICLLAIFVLATSAFAQDEVNVRLGAGALKGAPGPDDDGWRFGLHGKIATDDNKPQSLFYGIDTHIGRDGGKWIAKYKFGVGDIFNFKLQRAANSPFDGTLAGGVPLVSNKAMSINLGAEAGILSRYERDANGVILKDEVIDPSSLGIYVMPGTETRPAPEAVAYGGFVMPRVVARAGNDAAEIAASFGVGRVFGLDSTDFHQDGRATRKELTARGHVNLTQNLAVEAEYVYDALNRKVLKHSFGNPPVSGDGSSRNSSLYVGGAYSFRSR